MLIQHLLKVALAQPLMRIIYDLTLVGFCHVIWKCKIPPHISIHTYYCSANTGVM